MNKFTFHWSSEIYGLGKTYRELFRVPYPLPLPFYSDHGIIASGVIDQNICEFKVANKTFLTFSKSIFQEQANHRNLRILGQIHPWVIYKERHEITREENPSLILFFPLHTTSGYDVIGMEDEDSCRMLNSLKDQTRIKVCLHWNDMKSSRETYFRKQGFEVITFGDPMDYSYVDNFYNYARRTKYAISESWTSGMAFLVDLGVPCQIIPRSLIVRSQDGKNISVGFHNPTIKRDIQEAERIFSGLNNEVTEVQRAYVREHLGYQYRKCTTSNQFAIFFLYFTSLPSWIARKVVSAVKIL